MTAAVKTAELGGKVLIFEQSVRVGGAGNVAGGTFVGVNTIIGQEAGLDDSVDLLLEDFEKLGGKGNFDPELARTYGETSGRVIDWLDQVLKVNFGERKPGYGAYQEMNRPRVHILAPADGDVSASMARGASGLVKTLKERLDEYIDQKQAYLLMETRVTGLIIEDDVIVGVTAQDKNGKVTTYRAPSTIIATGGYGYNEAWLKEFNFTNITSMVPPTATGSGYDFAREAGAAFGGMDFCTTYPGSIPVTGFATSIAADAVTFRDPIWVDKNGRRFTNEATADSKVKSDAWTAAEDNIVYVVFSGKSRTERNSPIGRMQNGWDRLEELAAEGKYVFKADSIAALARLAKIDEANLTATVNQYNQDIAAGRDSVFGRSTVLVPLTEGPFYAIYTVPFVMITSGGPKMNPQTQMIREDGSVIEGAFICGEIVGMGNVAGHTTIGGIGNGGAAVWGVIAAENALARARAAQ
jgi:succinate dehydrogenase/fumarate reductase flavoprotein subunit